jgi:gliding motility-associated-like protein
MLIIILTKRKMSLKNCALVALAVFIIGCQDKPGSTNTEQDSIDHSEVIEDKKAADLVLKMMNAMGGIKKWDELKYVPNAFSPNGDGINDLFYIFGNEEVEAINTLQVYSRWGELVFEVVDALPNDPAGAWDGTFNGRLMNNTIFVYWAEIRMADGSLELIKGDVTLVR